MTGPGLAGSVCRTSHSLVRVNTLASVCHMVRPKIPQMPPPLLGVIVALYLEKHLGWGREEPPPAQRRSWSFIVSLSLSRAWGRSGVVSLSVGLASFFGTRPFRCCQSREIVFVVGLVARKMRKCSQNVIEGVSVVDSGKTRHESSNNRQKAYNNCGYIVLP